MQCFQNFFLHTYLNMDGLLQGFPTVWFFMGGPGGPPSSPPYTTFDAGGAFWNGGPEGGPTKFSWVGQGGPHEFSWGVQGGPNLESGF